MADEFNESDYLIAGSGTSHRDSGEYGPLDCGCYLVALTMDPVGPRLCLIMQRKDATWHEHTFEDFDGKLWSWRREMVA